MEHIEDETLSATYLNLYTALLKSLTYDNLDETLEDLSTELTLGIVRNDDSVASKSLDSENAGRRHYFLEDELLIYGMPTRRHLSLSASQRLREEINATLQSILELFHVGRENSEPHHSLPTLQRLPEDIQNYKDEINVMQAELDTMASQLAELVSRTHEMHDEFDRDIEHLIRDTHPARKASQNASVDLLAATLEATLQKLCHIRECAQRAFYNHRNQKCTTNSTTIAQAISTAFQTLKEEEKDLKVETQNLDKQIQEYEQLLQLVDGTSGNGYQQIVNDWLKVKRETDECLKDLRRLGWTGD